MSKPWNLDTSVGAEGGHQRRQCHVFWQVLMAVVVAATLGVANRGSAQEAVKASPPSGNAGEAGSGGLIRVVPISEAPLGMVVPLGRVAPTSAGTIQAKTMDLTSGCTATGAQIQSALDSASAAGGGTVYLAPGVYCIDEPLIVGSSVYLVGAGIGSTILRGKAGSYTGKIVNGAGVWATVAAVAADGASIRGLTVDHATNGTYDNGIALLPDGSGFSGTPCTRCVIEDVQVLGSANLHTYQIWNLRGQDIKILNNWVDGGVATYTPGSSQEGIESFGGTGVLISGNTIRNVGDAGLNLGSAGVVQDSGITGVVAVDNYISHCNIGVNVGAAYDSTVGSQEAVNTHIKDNVIRNTWTSGIYATTPSQSANRDLQITGNTVSGVGTATTSGFGIVCYGDPTVAVTPSSAVMNVISDNNIDNAAGANGFGIVIVQYPNVRLLRNNISGSGHSGIYGFAANGCEISENMISSPGRSGILVVGSSLRPTIRNNTIWQWATLAGAAGISVQSAQAGVVQGNSFYFDNSTGVEPSAVRVEAACSLMTVAGNTLLFAPRMNSPFVNLSSSPNRGQFAAGAGATVITVSNASVSATSQVVISQTYGRPITFTVQPNLGGFVVTLADSANGGEVFSYQVTP